MSVGFAAGTLAGGWLDDVVLLFIGTAVALLAIFLVHMDERAQKRFRAVHAKREATLEKERESGEPAKGRDEPSNSAPEGL